MSNDKKFSISRSKDVQVTQGDGNRTAKGDNSFTVQGDNNQAVRGNNNQLSQGGGSQAKEEDLTKDDVVKLLADLEKLIDESDLSADSKEEADAYLKAAKKAIAKPEPKKKPALTNMEQVKETLEGASKVAVAGQKFWKAAGPIVLKVMTWLGAAAAGSALGGL